MGDWVKDTHNAFFQGKRMEFKEIRKIFFFFKKENEDGMKLNFKHFRKLKKMKIKQFYIFLIFKNKIK